jgi:hypothetical protein
MANIKVDATLLDMAYVPEQQEHLRSFIEGKTSVVANLTLKKKRKNHLKIKFWLYIIQEIQLGILHSMFP